MNETNENGLPDVATDPADADQTATVVSTVLAAAFRCPNCGDAFDELAAPCLRVDVTRTTGATACAGKYFAIPAEHAGAGATDRWVGRKLNDKILLGPLLGKGGMGSVYKGWQLGLMKRAVAVKMLYTGSGVDKTARDRFVREAHANALLRHEHIVQVYDADEAAQWDPPMPFIVMEIVENAETLKDRIRAWRQNPPPLSDVATTFDELLDALAYAHKKKIVHRDVKPANVMIQRAQDGAETLKVLDFGLARSFGASDDEDLASVSGSKDSVLGTVAYMAPEQALGEPVDGRADVYAVGSILFELLVGVRPFMRLGLNDLQMLLAKSQLDPVTPEGGMPPGGLERLGKLGEVLVGMMQRNPAERWDAAVARKRLAVAFEDADVTLPLSAVSLHNELQTVDATRPTQSLAGALADSAARSAAAASVAALDHGAQTMVLDSNASSTMAGVALPRAPVAPDAPVPPAARRGTFVAVGVGAAVLAALAVALVPRSSAPPTPPPSVAAAAAPAPAAPAAVAAVAPVAAAVPAAAAPPPPPAAPAAAPVAAAAAVPAAPAAAPAAAAKGAAKPAEPVPAAAAPEPAKPAPAKAAPADAPAREAPAAARAAPAEKPAAAVEKAAPAPEKAADSAPPAAESKDAFKADGNFIHHKHISKEGKEFYLTWQRTPSGSEVRAEAAEAYCDHLAVGGYSNWRLPTASELRLTNTGDATGLLAFPGQAAGLYWAAGKGGPVIVGIRASAGDAETARVRCVQ